MLSAGLGHYWACFGHRPSSLSGTPTCRTIRQPSRCPGLASRWATERILRCEEDWWGHSLSGQGQKGQAGNTRGQQGGSQGKCHLPLFPARG